MSTEHEKRDVLAGDVRRRSVVMQCNPAVAALACFIALAIMGAAEIHKHETGIVQAIRGAAAGVLTLAVLTGLHALARWISAQDAPREPAIPLIMDETAATTSLHADADMAAMAADADALRDGRLDMVFTAGGNLFELDDSPAGGEA